MSFEKVVKLACKPKAAPPKAKYIDAIITATYADDGSVHDICRALAGRLKEPSSIVVFKALITLHQMIRSGSTDNILGYLSQQDILRLRNVSSQPWEGYSPPSNLTHYARYLDVRIRGYRELKHDPVRVQADSNRMSKYEGISAKARKLRQLTVDKGLLREVKQVQRMIDSLLECKLPPFYDDDLHDECTVVALRMLLKDLLVMFQAGNEGVINVLEHYFEMSKVDATDALAVYKSFCKQTDNVVEYLSMARKLVNLLNVPVPNLKHAPVSLAKALEEYLEDPNFEQNRLEYKANMSAVDGLTAAPSSNPAPTPSPAHQPEKPTPASNSSKASTAPPAASGQKAIQDFFESIQADQQPTMFSHQTGTGGFSQSSLGAPAQFNPFRQSTMPAQATGFMNMQPQMTGYSQSMPFQQQNSFNMQGAFNPGQQQTFMASNASAPAWHSSGPSPFIQPQHTAQQAYIHQPLQAQPTGSNPFRQSTFFSSAPPSQSPSPFGPAAALSGGTAIHQQSSSHTASGPGGNQQQPLLSQPTGSKNPFAPPVSSSAPPVPTTSTQRGPSLRELATGGPSTSNPQSWLATSTSNFGTMPPSLISGGMSGIASAFVGDKPMSPSNADGGLTTGLNWTNRVQSPPETPSGQQAPATAGFQPQRTGFLQPQQTGFTSNVKPFKPTSNFGSTLVESLPPIDQIHPQQTGFGQLQTTGIDTQANPFRKPAMGGAGPAGLPSAFAVSGHGNGPSGTNNAFNNFSGFPAAGQGGPLL